MKIILISQSEGEILRLMLKVIQICDLFLRCRIKAFLVFHMDFRVLKYFSNYWSFSIVHLWFHFQNLSNVLLICVWMLALTERRTWHQILNAWEFLTVICHGVPPREAVVLQTRKLFFCHVHRSIISDMCRSKFSKRVLLLAVCHFWIPSWLSQSSRRRLHSTSNLWRVSCNPLSVQNMNRPDLATSVEISSDIWKGADLK